ncbi:hypothetical protein AB205_0002820 [Aquarana catesbeiana]|uniref:Uncharacterized protein n=1 Tax=Aquarana catesbeiana TaxID=8400 RepID=A0A2G9S3N6_AQUCT|nr:hypothetical protein AB205_0002820 [Aquarana catesbeiana]
MASHLFWAHSHAALCAPIHTHSMAQPRPPHFGSQELIDSSGSQWLPAAAMPHVGKGRQEQRCYRHAQNWIKNALKSDQNEGQMRRKEGQRDIPSKSGTVGSYATVGAIGSCCCQS